MIELSNFESALIVATLETNIEFWAQQMNMRLKELAASIEGKRAGSVVPADVAAPIHAAPVSPAPVAAHVTPVPPMASISPANVNPTGGKMSSLADLAAMITANKSEQTARTAELAQKAGDLKKRATAAMDQSESLLEAQEHDIAALEASLSPDAGHNGGGA
ncbi:hypothetical protein [Bradyrhizobium sp. Ai1a-2]|uniref:hypothetical protein n=1 Tax=Bradyrhizobium sp. Ai1a-2 TaxID=196490 RepID=UPI000482F4B2|nr:hypothetical protein [Bradyrhizobium sp. Ai1a-2]